MTGQISFRDLAEKCDILEIDLKRIVRYTAAFNHVFCEPETGFVAHTMASKKIAENEAVRSAMRHLYEHNMPSHFKVRN